MDAQQFDALTKALGSGAARRRVLGALAGGLVAVLGRQAGLAGHTPEHCAKAGQKPQPGNSGKGCCAGLTEGADGRCSGVGSPPQNTGRRCNARTCPQGCCDGRTCFTENSWEFCGTGGAACQTCANEQVCAGPSAHCASCSATPPGDVLDPNRQCGVAGNAECLCYIRVGTSTGVCGSSSTCNLGHAICATDADCTQAGFPGACVQAGGDCVGGVACAAPCA
jgi:hypothetical protein